MSISFGMLVFLLSLSCTLKELCSSEKEYVERLDFCLTNYKQTIVSSNAAPKALKGLVPDLFTNIEDIHKFHKE